MAGTSAYETYIRDRAYSRVIASAGRTGRFYGQGGKPFVTVTTIPVSGGTVYPAASLRISGLLAKLAATAGWNFRLRFTQGATSVNVLTAYMDATRSHIPFATDLKLSYDRKWAFAKARTPAIFGEGSLSAGTHSLYKVESNNLPVNLSPRGQTAGPAFASYSAPPTVETVLIDFANAFEIELQIAISEGECAELLDLTVEMLSHGPDGANYAAPTATYCAGDSLTEGTGATTGTDDWVTLLGQQRPGRPLLNTGLGGQKIEKVIDRVLDDPVAGRHWDLILWAGTNDATGDAALWWGTMLTQLERLFAFRAPGARTLICNLLPSEDWFTPGEVAAALPSVNASLAAHATYGSLVCDLYAVLATDPGGHVPAAYRADALHLNGTGYGVVKDAIDAKMTALGWA